jgi:hypothetical protein
MDQPVSQSVDPPHHTQATPPTKPIKTPTYTTPRTHATHLRVAAEGDHLVHLLELERDLPEACLFGLICRLFGLVGQSKSSGEGRMDARVVSQGSVNQHTHQSQPPNPKQKPERTGHELLEALPAQVVVALAGLVARLRGGVQLLQPGLVGLGLFG